MASEIIVDKKNNTVTSTTNASSKKTQAELDAIKNKKNMTHSEIMKDMEDEFASKKKEKKDFSKMNKTDFSKMTEEQLLELHRRQRDLGSTSATKIYKKGGVVKMRGGGAAIRGLNFNKGK
jgi:DNA anti-recombination protein RmuC